MLIYNFLPVKADSGVSPATPGESARWFPDDHIVPTLLTILIVLTIIAANILHVDDTPFILPEDYILHLAIVYGG